MVNRTAPKCSDSFDKKIGLVLQGGGALGSYQAGAYEALADSDYLPDWVAGISIGAINAAIIAGNAPEDRVQKLRAFWDGITAPTALWAAADDGWLDKWQRNMAAQVALTHGQPGFFSPLSLPDWFSPTKPVSYYDTSMLKDTLESLVDFDRINDARDMRFSVGAVNVRTGNFAYFDNKEITIRAEHVMASGALPPGFPAIEIDGEHYWDGGLVSNTPLQHLLDHYPRRSRLTFQVDVFQAHGHLPENLQEVSERDKDIRYSSRTRVNTDAFQQRHEVRHAINEMFKILPDEFSKTDQGKHLYSFGCVTEMDIVQLIYRPFAPQGATKDFEFSRNTMNARWDQGKADAQTTLQAAPWLAAKPPEVGVRVFDVIHDLLVAKNAAAATTSASASRVRPAPAKKPDMDVSTAVRSAKRPA